MTSDLLVQSLLGLVGLVLGSAVSAIAWRVPRAISWVSGRSACTSCGKTLGARDLIPVLTWLLARGRCRHCGARVSARYLLTEFLCAAWLVLLYRQIGPGFDYPFLALWGVLLIALLWIDLDFQLLPDVLTFPGTLLALAAVLQWPGGARHAIFGVLLGSGMLWLLGWAYFRLRGVEGMGGGDIKLAAMFGVVLGWQLTLLTLFVAAAAGSLWGGILIARGKGDGLTAIPFGTLLAPAAMIAFLWGGGWVDNYLALFPRG
jgi:leader peptidase (prepilin peptidase)/N-methyltransferase